METPDSRPSVREPSSQLSGSMVYVPQLSKSALDVLDGHSHTPPRYEEMSTGDLGDLLYYRFGYIGSSTSFMDYSYTNRFNSWGLVCSSVGGHNMQCRESERPPIMYFLTLLLESRAPLKDILMDLWDLSPDSLEPLAEVQSFIHIVNTNLKISTPYFLQQRGLHATRDCSWILAVSALSALQCLRRSLGPHTVDIARDLVSRGIPFQTFAKFKRPDIDVQSPPFTIPSLPIRLSDYTLDLGDYVAYEMMRDLFLCAPRCRAALQMGGIVWRLAQQCLPDSAVLCGPSQDALDGHCEVISCDEEKFCDDTLPDVALDLICGVYKIPTHGKYFHHQVQIHFLKIFKDNLLINLGGQNTMSGYQVAIIMGSGPMSAKNGL